MPRAPRRCPGDNGNCTQLIRNTDYCPEHTVSWAGPRTASSQITQTSRWKNQFKPDILKRDRHRCQIRYQGICTGIATVVDKIIPASQRPDLAYEPTNAQAACRECNDKKARTADRGRPEPPRQPT